MRICFFMLFCLLGLAFPGRIQAQTLQFSRVLLVSSVQTVPANKVWKVEGALLTYTGATTNYRITVNSNSITVATLNYTFHGNPFPFWLPAELS